MLTINQLLDKLWQQYAGESPEVLKIYNLFHDSGERVVNDHVAFRTFDDARINIDVLGSFFEDFGYQACGEYEFKVKKLFARHYEHKTDISLPKVFISQLLTREFSQFVQTQARLCTNTIMPDKLRNPSLLYSGVHWELDFDIYQKLLAESEYAAWVYVFGFRANHFTVFVNQLETLTSVAAVNSFLKSHGLMLNDSGGEIKGTPSELLEQSSTIANRVLVKFKQGTFEVLNSYYEFAKRYPKPDGKLYQGFIAASADKIFESTNVNM